ncbi:hypothetical protein B9G55_17285 [Saccharibacillus sp. O16]|nr:hypothetical protein B9G55_17285 [Saccharibacillus sp. O16]
MQLFRLSAWVQGRDRMEDFLNDCFVSLGYPEIGDLESADAQQVSKPLNRVYGYEGEQLQRAVEAVLTFASGMSDGDYVMVAHRGHAWLGDLGDYYYRQDADHSDEGTCHRRGVTWLGVLPLDKLSPLLRGFLCAEGEDDEAASDKKVTLARFPLSPALAGLEAFAAQAPGGQLPGLPPVSADPIHSLRATASESSRFSDSAAPLPLVEEETLREAISVLREALHSEELELRVRAAEALLRYAR